MLILHIDISTLPPTAITILDKLLPSIFLDSKGHVGAGMQGGSIFSKKKINTSPPATKISLGKNDIGFIRSSMNAGRVEAVLYNKYEKDLEHEKFVKVTMRDGSIVMRKISD